MQQSWFTNSIFNFIAQYWVVTVFIVSTILVILWWITLYYLIKIKKNKENRLKELDEELRMIEDDIMKDLEHITDEKKKKEILDTITSLKKELNKK